MKNILLLIVLVLAVPFLAGGVMSLNPATEEEELVLISSAEERNMGRKIDEKVREQFNLPVDPLEQKRISRIGEKLASGTDRKDTMYHFTVLDDEKDGNYNAFAAPGGYIYIFSDLVDVMATDDSIAAVLAHEMGHVEARHSVKRLQGSIGVTALMLLGSQAQGDTGTYAAANKAIGQLMAAYSRSDERQADELSTRYLRLAEFDAAAASGALKKLKKLRKKGPTMKFSFYRGHPYLSERIAYLEKYTNGYTNFDAYINIVRKEQA
ncbi:MAG: M48 family metalloprotease [Candidatus Omnitrophota bacterium]